MKNRTHPYEALTWVEVYALVHGACKFHGHYFFGAFKDLPQQLAPSPIERTKVRTGEGVFFGSLLWGRQTGCSFGLLLAGFKAGVGATTLSLCMKRWAVSRQPHEVLIPAPSAHGRLGKPHELRTVPRRYTRPPGQIQQPERTSELMKVGGKVSRQAAEAKALAVIEELRRQKLPKAAELIEEHVGETLTYYDFPDIHWTKLRTNSPLERIIREIRRRTRVVGAFPYGSSCLNLAAARLRHIARTQWSTRCYMNMTRLKEAKMATYGAAVA